MGILDAFNKIAKGVKIEPIESLLNNRNNKNNVSKNSDALGATKNIPDVISTGNTPSKPSYLYKDEYGEKEYAFMISGDFIEFNSHCEMIPSFQYEPFNNTDFTGYIAHFPHICIGPNDDIYEAVEEFEKNGNLPDGNYEICDSTYFAFRCKFEDHGYKYYAYAFRSNTARELEMLSVDYTPEIEGTPLEKKLIAILDEIASTYIEKHIN